MKWDDDEVYFVLDQHAGLHFYRASTLKQQSTLFLFRANQSLLFHLNAACLAETGLTRAGLEPTVYHTTRDSNYYATDAVLKNIRALLCKL